jgi:hypothetical protein
MKNKQLQRRNAGVSPLRFAPVEMTASEVAWERTSNDNNGKSEIRGFFAALRMTSFGEAP